MNNNQDFNELRKALHMLAHVLIAEGQAEGNRNKWFFGNALGTILIASEDQKDIERLSKVFQKFCEDKREKQEVLENLAKNLEDMPTQDIPGITDLLGGTGICLN